MIRVGLVHALRASIDPIEAAFADGWPEAETVNLFDQSLYIDYHHAGAVTPQITERIRRLLLHSADCGAQAILFTGSLFGDAVERAAADLKIPVLGAYEAMIERAFELGSRFVLLATVADTLGYLESDMQRYADRDGRDCVIRRHHVDGALAALLEGDRVTHDRLIVEAAAAADDCDALLLGQFSMAPVQRQIPDRPGRVVLNSPDAAVASLKSRLGN